MSRTLCFSSAWSILHLSKTLCSSFGAYSYWAGSSVPPLQFQRVSCSSGGLLRGGIKVLIGRAPEEDTQEEEQRILLIWICILCLWLAVPPHWSRTTSVGSRGGRLFLRMLPPLDRLKSTVGILLQWGGTAKQGQRMQINTSRILWMWYMRTIA